MLVAILAATAQEGTVGSYIIAAGPIRAIWVGQARPTAAFGLCAADNVSEFQVTPCRKGHLHRHGPGADDLLDAGSGSILWRQNVIAL